jgi:hypothetical protein
VGLPGSEDVVLFGNRLFEVMTNNTGLPYAPVMPDEVINNFEIYRELEEIEEEEIKLKEKEVMEEREKIVLKARAEGKEDQLDPEILHRYERDQKVKRRKETSKTEKAEKKKKEASKKDEFEPPEEDEEDKIQRQLLERRQDRHKIRKRAQERREKGEDDLIDTEADFEY